MNVDEKTPKIVRRLTMTEFRAVTTETFRKMKPEEVFIVEHFRYRNTPRALIVIIPYQTYANLEQEK